MLLLAVHGCYANARVGRTALLMWSESPGELSAPDTIILCGPRVIQQRTGAKAAKESAAPLATSRYTLDVTKARRSGGALVFLPGARESPATKGKGPSRRSRRERRV